MTTRLVFGQASDCDVRVDDPYVSTRHCAVTVRDDETVWVEDVGSTNGTWVDGEKIQGPRRIWPRAVIQIGRTRIPWERR